MDVVAISTVVTSVLRRLLLHRGLLGRGDESIIIVFMIGVLLCKYVFGQSGHNRV
jgi:hypothetical protein